MNVGALIPSGVNSNHSPEKEIELLGGRPLICRTIDPILEADTFEKITVSTESPKIVDVVRNHYSEKEVEILIRPEKLETIDNPLDNIFIHYLEVYSDIDIGACFLPTYPFRDVDKLKYIDGHIRSRYPWQVSSVTEERFCTGDFFFPKEEGVKRVFNAGHHFCQRFNSCYAYMTRNLAYKSIYNYGLAPEERHLIVTASPEEDIAVDSHEDFTIAENIANGKHMRILPSVEHTYENWTLLLPKGTDAKAFLNYIGFEKLNDSTIPILVLEKNHRNYARFLDVGSLNAKPSFISLEALRYMNTASDTQKGGSKSCPDEFKLNPYYRLFRTPSDSVKYEQPTMVPSIFPWERVVMYEELENQPFFVDPISFD